MSSSFAWFVGMSGNTFPPTYASLDNFEDGYLQNEGVFFNNKDL